MSRRLMMLAALAAASCALAACGASSSSSSSAASGGSGTSTSSATLASRQAKLQACLKQHGVTLPAFRRPAQSGTGTNTTGGGAPGAGGPPPGGAGGPPPGAGGLPGGGGAGRQLSTKDRAAFQACASDFGSGGPNGGARFRLSRTAITNFVACVRNHGYSLPNPNYSGNGPTFPASVRTNKKFIAASRSCASLLAPQGPSTPGGGTGSTTTGPTS